MSIHRCRTCRQPIQGEMAVETRAGGYTGGYCMRDAVAHNASMKDKELKQDEQISEQISEPTTEQVPGQSAAAEATEQEQHEASAPSGLDQVIEGEPEEGEKLTEE